jgi:hypothetical protein
MVVLGQEGIDATMIGFQTNEAPVASRMASNLFLASANLSGIIDLFHGDHVVRLTSVNAVVVFLVVVVVVVVVVVILAVAMAQTDQCIP